MPSFKWPPRWAFLPIWAALSFFHLKPFFFELDPLEYLLEAFRSFPDLGRPWSVMPGIATSAFFIGGFLSHPSAKSHIDCDHVSLISASDALVDPYEHLATKCLCIGYKYGVHTQQPEMGSSLEPFLILEAYQVWVASLLVFIAQTIWSNLLALPVSILLDNLKGAAYLTLCLAIRLAPYMLYAFITIAAAIYFTLYGIFQVAKMQANYLAAKMPDKETALAYLAYRPFGNRGEAKEEETEKEKRPAGYVDASVQTPIDMVAAEIIVSVRPSGGLVVDQRWGPPVNVIHNRARQNYDYASQGLLHPRSILRQAPPRPAVASAAAPAVASSPIPATQTQPQGHYWRDLDGLIFSSAQR